MQQFDYKHWQIDLSTSVSQQLMQLQKYFNCCYRLERDVIDIRIYMYGGNFGLNITCRVYIFCSSFPLTRTIRYLPNCCQQICQNHVFHFFFFMKFEKSPKMALSIGMPYTENRVNPKIFRRTFTATHLKYTGKKNPAEYFFQTERYWTFSVGIFSVVTCIFNTIRRNAVLD